MFAAAIPLISAAAGAFGAPGGGASAAPPPGGGGPAAFRSAGINVGSRVVGRGNASTDGQSSREQQTATRSEGAMDALGYSAAGLGARAWYARPGVIVGLVGAFVALGLGLFFMLRSKPASKK